MHLQSRQAISSGNSFSKRRFKHGVELHSRADDVICSINVIFLSFNLNMDNGGVLGRANYSLAVVCSVLFKPSEVLMF